jgi:hypothetical protein
MLLSDTNFLELFKKLRVLTKNNTLNSKRDLTKDFLVENLFYETFSKKAPIDLIVDIVINKNCVIPFCEICGKDLDLFNISNRRKRVYAHKECAQAKRKEKIDWNSAVQKRKQTCLNKYGSEAFFDYDSMVVQARETKKKLYGSENFVNVSKAKATKLKRYGSENYRNSDQIKKTCLEKYGSENPFASKEIANTITEKLQSKYGGRGFSSSTILSKIEKTNEEKYNARNPMQSSLVSLKSSNKKNLNYYGEDLFNTLTYDIENLYESYYNNNSLSINKFAQSLGIDRNTLARKFKRNGFSILDRSYSCSISSGEKIICNMLREIDPNIRVVRNTRSVISPKEIDVWLPDYNLGIEYHGSYWHTEDRVGDQHREKAIAAEKAGIRLIQLFDWELIEKYEKIVFLLKEILGHYSKKVKAEDCQIIQITSDSAKEFLDENSIESCKPASINYALIDAKNNIIQIAGFSQDTSDSYEWEVIAICSRLNVCVLGGAQKLWKKFADDFKPRSVIAYSNARFSDGSFFEEIGMNRVFHSESSYVFKDLVENQNIINNKKLLDAGNYVFVYSNNNIH